VSTVVHRLGLLLTALTMVLAVSQGTSQTALVATIAAVALAGVLAVRGAALVTGSRTITVGSRARAHREELTSAPAPSHPSTEGRPRTRAPSLSVQAA
jgi:hypothetical protein